jgi:hypothetical protein
VIPPPRRGEGGAGLFMVFMVVLFLFPMVFGAINASMKALRFSLKDRNLKTSRTIASSSLADYMRTFSLDYNRDIFDSIFVNRNNPSFVGLGSSTSTWTPDEPRKMIFITSRGTYQKPGINAKLVSDKGLDGSFVFRSDLTRFGLYLDASAVVLSNPIQFATPFCSGWTYSGTLWTQGGFDTTGCTVRFQNGVLVVPGEFRVGAGTTLGPNLKVYCRQFTDLGAADMGVTVNEYSATAVTAQPNNPHANNPFWPNLVVSEVNPGRDLTYYRTRNSTRVVTTDPLTLTFQLSGDVDIFNHTTGVTTVFSPVNENMFVVDGASVTIKGSITRPTTVVALANGQPDGGRIIVEDALVYYPNPMSASPTTTLAVLAEKTLSFSSTTGFQTVSGFYYGKEGIRFLTPVVLRVYGSLFGMPGAVPAAYNWTNSDVLVFPDPNLLRYYPPYMPKKPEVASWDYVG